MSDLFTTENMIALATLTGLEIVLGIDNIVFIAILCGRLPPDEREKARRLGLSLAMLTRIALLLALGWIMGLTRPLFTLPLLGHQVAGRDLILGIGGLFLIFKATREIHHKLEGIGEGAHASGAARHAAFGATIVQILLLDIVFSLDSVITAVGMAQHLAVMITAVVLAVVVMLVFSGKIGEFIERHPSLKMLALSFLLAIGVLLVADGCGHHLEKGYLYFAMAFSLAVELLNIRAQKRARPLQLRGPNL